MWIVLTPEEIELLDTQDPSTAKDGGFQSMAVRLQQSVRRGTRELKLSEDDIEQIAKYAFDYKQGGWEDRLKGIFSRTLGPNLGRGEGDGDASDDAE
jgi:hypothetical protein